MCFGFTATALYHTAGLFRSGCFRAALQRENKIEGFCQYMFCDFMPHIIRLCQQQNNLEHCWTEKLGGGGSPCWMPGVTIGVRVQSGRNMCPNWTDEGMRIDSREIESARGVVRKKVCIQSDRTVKVPRREQAVLLVRKREKKICSFHLVFRYDWCPHLVL